MPLASKFLSRKLSKSFPELSRPPVKEAADEEGLSPPGGVMGRVESPAAAAAAAYGQSWGTMLPKLLGEIIRRVEASADRWPQRQDVVACACVCKRWRDVTKEIVRASLNSEMIAFPSCLKQPGPRDFSHQCLIIRNRKDSTFYLYLTPSFTDKGKFLLAARRYRRFAHYEYIISHDANDLSQGSNAYVGKLSSDFIGTNCTIYDSQPPHSGARPSSSWASRWFASKQISPQVPASNFKVGHVTYGFNLKLRCPWRMVCSLKLPSCSGGEASPAPEKETNHLCEPNMKKSGLESASSCSGYTVLRNEAPWWIEHLQCWCLNFHGRVTWPSVQNFKIVATVDQSQGGGKGDKEETVLLQFGSVGVDVDTFTMDFRQPLSAFQAFAICLTTFGMKIVTE